MSSCDIVWKIIGESRSQGRPGESTVSLFYPSPYTPPIGRHHALLFGAVTSDVDWACACSIVARPSHCTTIILLQLFTRPPTTSR
jgi:hypothetical protein